MVELNNMLKISRMVVFGITSFFAFIVIILGGLVTSFTSSFFGFFFDYAALAIATGVLTVLSLPTMLALSIVRKGAFTSMIAVDIAWTWFLWIMWLAVGGDTATDLILIGSCSFVALGSQAACNESSGIAALAFLSWIALLFYNVLLFSLTFRQHLRGNTGIWTKDVTETDFTAVGASNTQISYDNKVSSPSYQYPPAGTPQQSYTQAQPQPPAGLYNQPQGVTGSFTQPGPGMSPYPQV